MAFRTGSPTNRPIAQSTASELPLKKAADEIDEINPCLSKIETLIWKQGFRVGDGRMHINC